MNKSELIEITAKEADISKDEKDAWSIPVNIGPTIKTEGDDESPFLHPDGVTLYLRSNGTPGMQT